MRTRRLLTVLACVGWTLISAAADAPLADRLPEKALFYAGWAGRSLVFDGSVLGELLRDPSVAQLGPVVRDLMGKHMPAGQEKDLALQAWELIGIGWQHPAAMVVVETPAGGESSQPVDAGLLLDVGKDHAAFEEGLSKLLKKLGPDTPVTESVEGALPVRTVKLPEGATLSIAWKGDVLVAATGGLFRELLAVDPARSLATSKRFAEARREVAGENEQAAVFADVTALRALAERLTASSAPATAPLEYRGPATGPAEAPASAARKILEALGLEKVTAVAGVVRVVDHGLYTKVRVLTPAPHRGLLMLAAGSPLSEQDLASVPEDADVFAAVKLSPFAAFAELLRSLRQADPKLEADFLRAVESAEKELKLSISNDLLAALGDTWVLSSAASQGGYNTGTVLTVAVKDAPKLQTAIGKIETYVKGKFPTSAPAAGDAESADVFDFGMKVRPRIEVLQAGKAEIHYLSGLPIVLPAWTVHKERLYLAAWPQVIETVLDRADAGQFKGLASSDAFRGLRARLSDKTAGLGYVNWNRVSREAYSSLLILGGMGMWGLSNVADGGGAGVRGGIVPFPMALSKLERYCWPELTGFWADDQGLTMESYGGVPAVGLAAPTVAAIALPALYKAREQAIVVKESARLRMVAVGLSMYAVDNDGLLPPSLEDPAFAKCLGAESPDEPEYRKHVAGVVLVAPGRISTLESPGEVAVAYLAPGPADKIVWVAYADGHIAEVPREAFEDLLAQSKKALQGSAQTGKQPQPEKF